ncbi:leucine-rich repeat domain-containing protein [Fusibacter bizertensis]
MVDNTMFVPLGFISTFFGSNIKWDASTKTASIYNDDDDIITLKDEKIEKEIRSLINKPTGELIKYDVRYITELNLNGFIEDEMEELVDISDLKYFESLKDLTIHITNVSDLRAIKNLKNLERLNLSLSPIENIDALKSLVNLKYLFIDGCPVSDLTAITNLTELNVLSLTNCPVTNYSPLRSLVNLTNLWINGCPMSNIEPIKNLTNLLDIRIRNTSVSDLSYLTNLSKLRRADLSYNKIKDISPLENLKKLESLDISGNVVLDYKPILGKLPNMEAFFSIRQQAIDQAKIILKNIIKDNMTDLEKEKAIHDYLVLNTKYDIDNYYNHTIPKDSYEEYGVILNGVGVCSGYAKATLLLLTLADIKAEIITGAAKSNGYWLPHAWNRVLIDGVWYNLDVTWDDPVPDRGQTTPRTKYFNISDEAFRINHWW